MDETKAIARLQHGDIGGLEFLVRKYQISAIRAAYLIVLDRAMAEDIVHSGFLHAYERIHQVDTSKLLAHGFIKASSMHLLKPWINRSVMCQRRLGLRYLSGAQR